ncbi:hypothetical protein ACHQM5_012440 [Ranunculus cassubicifolius]
MEADWSAIPSDLLPLIGSKLVVYVDRVRFRSVSRSWRSAIIPFLRAPWLVLSESDLLEKHYAVEPRMNRNKSVPLLPRGFVCFGEQKIYEIDLPEAHERKIIGSRGTMLITVGKDGMIHLLNPFTRIPIQLPSVKTFSNYDTKYYKQRVRVRDDVADKIILLSSSDRDCIAMAIHGPEYQLSFARPGDSSWTRCPTPADWVFDLVFYKEKFYAINWQGTLMVCDISDCQSSSIVMPGFEVDFEEDFDVYSVPQFESFEIGPDCDKNFYLAEWMGELLMVIKIVDKKGLSKYTWDDEEENTSSKTRRCLERMKRTEETVLYRTTGFKIYKLDFSNSNWVELKNLGEYSLFLGRNTSVSILASYHGGIKKNCIYFTDDWTNLASVGDMSCGRDMGVFDVEKKDIQPHYRGTSTSIYSPPLWLIPETDDHDCP